MTRAVPFLAAAALLAACAAEPTSTRSASDVGTQASTPAAATSHPTSPDVNRDLATLRRVTASFHDFSTATDAGWSAQITPCMTHPDSGGMGFHYANPALVDGSVQVDQPEVLLYEPEKNGRLRLVAVEYIIPVTAWTSPTPPTLFGREFRVNQVFQVWALHAWVWDNNPTGIFTDWNPRVDCQFAPTASTMRMRHD